MYCPACGHLNLPGNDACEKCLVPLAHVDGPVPADRVELSLTTDTVAVLAPREPVTVPADATLGDAVRLMVGRKVGAVLVVDPAGALVGILTERDFLHRVAGEPDYATRGVREFMTPHPETVGPADSLAFALGKMDAGGYRHLPVVDGGKPVGVVSVRDLLRHVTRLCQDG